MEIANAFTLASGVLWSVVYVLIFFQAFRDRTYAMPFIALCTNLTWEFLFSFVYQFRPFMLMDLIWFLFDLGILYTYAKFWRSDYPRHLSPRLVWVRFGLTCLAVGGLISALVGALPQHVGVAQVHSAFVDNMIMSVAFLAMLVKRGSRRGQSMAIAWTKLAGTAAASIGNFLLAPHAVLFNILYVEIFFFDLLYVLMLYKLSWWIAEPGTDAEE